MRKARGTIAYALEGLQRRINIINSNHRKELMKIYGSKKRYQQLAQSR